MRAIAGPGTRAATFSDIMDFQKPLGLWCVLDNFFGLEGSGLSKAMKACKKRVRDKTQVRLLFCLDIAIFKELYADSRWIRLI